MCVFFCCFVCVVLLYILCFLCINCVYNYKKNSDICLSLFSMITNCENMAITYKFQMTVLNLCSWMAGIVGVCIHTHCFYVSSISAELKCHVNMNADHQSCIVDTKCDDRIAITSRR